MINTTILVPTYCARRGCNRWGRWTLFITYDDGSEDRIHFCKQHGNAKLKELDAGKQARILRSGNGVLKS